MRILGIQSPGKRGKRKHIISSVIVIACSVIPLILAIYLANSMTEGITGKYISLSSFHAQVQSYEPLEKVDPDSIIEQVFPIRETFCLFYSQNGSYTTNVKGVTEDYILSDRVRDEIMLKSGDLCLFDSADIVITTVIAEALEVIVGDTIAVVTVTQQSGQARIKPSIFHITGIIESGYNDLDGYLSYIDIEQARKIMKDDSNEYFGIFVSSEAAENPAKIKAALSDQGYVITWDELNRSLYNNFKTSKLILYIIMVLIIFIATFNVSSTCIMLIQDKYLDIGLMKSIGVSKRTIEATFFFISILIGAIGSFIGIIIGILLSSQLNNILQGLKSLGFSALDFYLIELPFVMNWNEIILVGLLTTLLSGISSIIPIKRIHRILPIHMLNE